MNIVALIADLSGNSIVRSYPIIRVLQRKHNVQVVGVLRSGDVFEPFRNALDYVTIPAYKNALWPERTVLATLGRIRADVVYAFKPVACSYGVGLVASLRDRVPLMLDIEDFDNIGFAIQGRLWKMMAPLMCMRTAERRIELYDWVVDQLHTCARQKTVVSRFLQRRYGGTMLPHGPDPCAFNPALYSRDRVRREFGFDGKRVILFAGTVRDHKGLDHLCTALIRLKALNCVLAICGVRTPVTDKLTQTYPDLVCYLGPQRHERMPALWLAADLVVLPQKSTLYTQAQVPGKVFEAMAMARPVVASAVSDLPEILDKCGWLVEPENAEQLVEAIHDAITSKSEAEERGHKARTRYLERYSWDVMEGILDKVVANIG